LFSLKKKKLRIVEYTTVASGEPLLEGAGPGMLQGGKILSRLTRSVVQRNGNPREIS